MVELNAVAYHPDGRKDCPGTQGDGKYLKVWHGITIGSGACAFVMPETWSPGTSREPLEGSQAGQQFVSVTGETRRTLARLNLT